MLTCSAKWFTVALLLILAAAAPLSGQTRVLVGFGSTFPVGAFGDGSPFGGANAGWQGTIGLHHTVGSSGLGLGARAYYGENGYEGPYEEDSSLSGVTALSTFTLADRSVSPLLWSEAGAVFHKYSADTGGGLPGGIRKSDESAFVIAGGVGARMPIRSSELLLLGGFSKGFGDFDDVGWFILAAAIGFAL